MLTRAAAVQAPTTLCSRLRLRSSNLRTTARPLRPRRARAVAAAAVGAAASRDTLPIA